MANASNRWRMEAKTSHDLIMKSKALVARALIVHEESQGLVAHARKLVLPVMCDRCGIAIFWKEGGPPYTEALCDRCRTRD
jgi:hypothetical protein